MIILTDGTVFLDTFGEKIEQLKKALDVSVDVDAYDLIEQLKGVEVIIPAIKSLVQAIDEIDVPKVPESIKVEGMDEATDKMVEATSKMVEASKLLEKISEIDLPAVEVNVKSVSKQEANKIADKVDKLVKSNENTVSSNTKLYDNVIASIDSLVKAVIDNSNTPVKQATGDYIPVRRVRKAGNVLIFDDDAYSGSSGGGGGIPTSLTRNDSQALAIVNSDGTGVDNSSVIYDNYEPVTPKFAIISESNSGSNEVVAAVTGKKIRILSYAFVSSGTVNAKWQSASNDISGLMYFIANTGISAGYNPKGHFQTAAGEALNLNLSGSVAVGGHITYIEVD